MSIIEEIKVHEKNVLSGKIPATLRMCPKCGECHLGFKLHERRKRQFLIIVGEWVRRVDSHLARLKCRVCGGSFMDYPQFALPHKRFTVKDIVNLGRRYVEKPSMTYQKVVLHDDSAIGYDGVEAEREGRQLWGSSVWRWLSFSGGLVKTVKNALHLIRQANPNCGIFRELYPVHPEKHRSEKRKRVLEQSLRLFNAEDEYRGLFGRSIFPHLATGNY